MNIINLTQPTPEPAAKLIATGELAHLNASLARRVEEHSARYAAFWDNEKATPDEILMEMGENALTWLSCASESINHISRLAAIVGLSLTDFLPIEKWQPRREFVILDNVVTLVSPNDGYDEHGVLIPIPFEEPVELP